MVFIRIRNGKAFPIPPHPNPLPPGERETLLRTKR
jgi:hypothetical protein